MRANAVGCFGIAERQHSIRCTAHLERAGFLQVLALKENRRTGHGINGG
jgi:hypothetical protein